MLNEPKNEKQTMRINSTLLLLGRIGAKVNRIIIASEKYANGKKTNAMSKKNGRYSFGIESIWTI